MLWWAVVFLIIAIIAAIFGFGGIAAGAMVIAKILFVIFLILFIIPQSSFWCVADRRVFSFEFSRRYEMSKYSIAVVAVLAATGLGLAGCQKGGNQAPANQASPSQQIKQGAKQMGTGIMAAGKKFGRNASQAASDTAITTKVKAKLAANQGLSSFNVHVETDHGVVTLTGTVDMESKRDLAGRIAEHTDGVKRVVNNIVVTQNAGG